MKSRPELYDDLSALARKISETADEARSLALTLGEIGASREAEDTRTTWLHIASVQRVRADEARLVSGELRITPAVAAIHDVLASFRPKDHSTAHRDAAVRAGTWAKLDAFGDVEPMVTPGILAELEAK